jgi:hypothetical protein
MWRIIGPERNMPPADFQDRLAYFGGVNRFDQPNFIIWWAQYAYGEGSFRSGGAWSVDEAFFQGYRDILRASGEPCWALGQFHEAIEYGTPESYYVQNYDDATGLQLLGGYPYSGRYELLYNLRWHDRVGDKLEFHTMPLTSWVFEMVIPIIVKAKEISAEKRKQADIEARRKVEDEKLLRVERTMRANALPFSDSVSYTRQGIRSTLIDQKYRAMQRDWNKLSDTARAFRPGLQTR